MAERNRRPLNSVETLVFDPTDLRAARLAADGRVGAAVAKLREAEAVFFGGGDQFVYFAIWGGTEFLGALDEKFRSGRVVVGGSSAGMHVLGGLSYLNEPNPYARPNQAGGLAGMTSTRAIADPAGVPMTLREGFVTYGWARDLRVLTDTHFGQRQTGEEIPANLRGRMGRLVAFLARLKAGQPDLTFRGLAADEATAVLVEAAGDRKGQGTVVGKGSAYLLTTPDQPPRSPAGTSPNGGPAPLTFGPLQVYKLDGGDVVNPAALDFDFAVWRPVVGGVRYAIAAEGGSLTNLTDPARRLQQREAVARDRRTDMTLARRSLALMLLAALLTATPRRRRGIVRHRRPTQPRRRLLPGPHGRPGALRQGGRRAARLGGTPHQPGSPDPGQLERGRPVPPVVPRL